jgi:hypothetical protein
MKPTPEQKLKRALWLAFQASSAVGMGFLHAGQARQQTENSLFEDAMAGRSGKIYTDYLCGRMMKTEFFIDGDSVVVRPELPRLDYQSWGAQYPTASDLLRAVDESFAALSQLS